MRKIDEIEHLEGCICELQRAAHASTSELRDARGECAQAAERLRSLQQGHVAAMQQVCISSICKPEWTHGDLSSGGCPRCMPTPAVCAVAVAYLCLPVGDMLRP
jgi:hypothetical protein